MLKIFDASKGEEKELFAALESRAGREAQEISQKVRQVIEDAGKAMRLFCATANSSTASPSPLSAFLSRKLQTVFRR